MKAMKKPAAAPAKTGKKPASAPAKTSKQPAVPVAPAGEWKPYVFRHDNLAEAPEDERDELLDRVMRALHQRSGRDRVMYDRVIRFGPAVSVHQPELSLISCMLANGIDMALRDPPSADRPHDAGD